jgi:putative transposase
MNGKAIKLASMIDEHTRRTPLHVVERSLTAERLVSNSSMPLRLLVAAEDVADGHGPELVSQAVNDAARTRWGFPTFRR